MRALRTLYNALQSLGLTKYAQDVKDLEEEEPDREPDEEYAEPWHEEVIKELEDEEEEQLRKTVPYYGATNKHNKMFYDILADNGIQPIEVDGEVALGAGVEGIVFNAIYNKQPVAVKVSRMVNEFEKWQAIMAAVDKMPEQLRKYFPKIYEAKSDPATGHSIIVMEKLIPLPKEVERAWRKGREDLGRKFYIPDYYSEIRFKRRLEDYLHRRTDYQGEVSVPSREYIKENAAHQAFNEDYIIELIMNWLKAKNPKAVPDEENDYDGVTRLVEQLVSYFVHELKGQANRATNKYDGMEREYIKQYEGNLPPEFEGILESLYELAEYGIKWVDLHSGNVLISPVTKEIKIVDIGRFNIPGISMSDF
jgi:hypothetical protein